MNRREFVAALSAALPLGSGIRIETLPGPSDIVIIECDGVISRECADRIRSSVGQILGPKGPRVIAHGSDMTVRVERNILRVENPS